MVRQARSETRCCPPLGRRARLVPFHPEAEMYVRATTLIEIPGSRGRPSLGDRTDDATGIARGEYPFGNVPRDDAAGSDDGA